MDQTVDLHPAHEWQCPGCERVNFARAVPAELTVAEQASLVRQELDLEPWESVPDEVLNQQGMWLTAPPEVTCEGCGREFSTRDHRE